MTHLEALTFRRFNEAARLRLAKTDAERALRKVWLAQIDKEIAQEIVFLGKADDLPAMTDDELLAELEK